MFCTQCGAKIPDNSKFCGACGAKQEQVSAVETPRVSVDETVVVKPPVETNVVQEWSVPEETTVTQKNKLDLSFLKNFGTKKILMAAGALVLVIALVVGMLTVFANKGSENAYVCYSDGKYKLVTNMKKAETLNIASAKSDDVSYYSVHFSPDGKYIYFFTKCDYDGVGSLNRARYAKLKAGSGRNDKYIETIASNVDSYSLSFMEDGNLFYKNDDDTLYYYNGKESTQLAKRVNTFHADEKGRLVYSVRDDEGQSSMYALKLKSPDEKTKLVSNYSEARWGEDLDHILFTKENDDGTRDLYKTSFDGKDEKLGENASFIATSEGKYYLTIGAGETLSMYQFVNDPNAAAEAAMTEPVEEDFIVPDYAYNMITKSNVQESNTTELYTSCSRALYWYGESTWWSYSMDDALDRSWGDKTVQIHEATRNFINKYGNTADDNGYIKVTAEVKAALQEINAAGGGYDWQWLWLCFDKVESGTTFDYDAWDVARSEWYAVRDRVALREQLKDKANDIPVKNLCVFEDGKLSVVANNVVDYKSMGGALLYNTVDMLGDAVNIADVYSVYDVYQTVELDMQEQNHYIYLKNGSEGRITESVLTEMEEVDEDGNVYLRFSEKNVYLYDREGYLAVAPIKGKEIGSFEQISEDAGEFAINEDVVLYAAGIYSNDYVEYCDIYEYKNGENKLLARDVLYNLVNFYEDGQLLTYTDYSRNSGYELSMVNKKGEMTLMSDDISQFRRVDKTLLLYISDGDLYMYDGKDKKMVCSDVDMFWVKEQMEVTASIYA